MIINIVSYATIEIKVEAYVDKEGVVDITGIQSALTGEKIGIAALAEKEIKEIETEIAERWNEEKNDRIDC